MAILSPNLLSVLPTPILPVASTFNRTLSSVSDYLNHSNLCQSKITSSDSHCLGPISSRPSLLSAGLDRINTAFAMLSTVVNKASQQPALCFHSHTTDPINSAHLNLVQDSQDSFSNLESPPGSISFVFIHIHMGKSTRMSWDNLQDLALSYHVGSIGLANTLIH